MHAISGRDLQDLNYQLQVAVVGGSLAGLMAAISLRNQNCHVQVFEKSSAKPKESQGAGIVAQSELVDLLKRNNIIESRDQITVKSKWREYLDRSGNVIIREDKKQYMTSWGILFRSLKSALPSNLYHSKKTIKNVAHEEGYSYLIDADNTKYGPFDLVVACDGPDSTIRKLLLPQVKREYAGYVGWRGLVPEQELGEKKPVILDKLGEKFVFFHDNKTQILSYLIPGNNDGIEKSERNMNWVWYWNVPDLTQYSMSTDKYSIPRTKVPKELVRQQQGIASKTLPSVYSDLVEMTEEPFIQAITDLSSPQMYFPELSTVIMGDAAFGVRPHTAAATAKAAQDASNLEVAIKQWRHNGGDLCHWLKKWERSQINLGNDLVQYGKYLGNKSQFGDHPAVKLLHGTAVSIDQERSQQVE
jgi:2-polyprenyl-6-methoxyphenol hydroxylase-like FAD-dependent oxidoreductase